MVSLPARLDDVGLAFTDMWSGNEISVGHNEFYRVRRRICFCMRWLTTSDSNWYTHCIVLCGIFPSLRFSI